MSDIHTYSMCLHEAVFPDFQKWLKKQGFIFQGRPSYRRLFRSLRLDRWHRQPDRPIPKHDHPGPRLQKIAIETCDWDHVRRAIVKFYHNDPTNLILDLIAGNWTRSKAAKPSKAA